MTPEAQAAQQVEQIKAQAARIVEIFEHKYKYPMAWEVRLQCLAADIECALLEQSQQLLAATDLERLIAAKDAAKDAALREVVGELNEALQSGALFNPEMFGSMLRAGDNPILRWSEKLRAALAGGEET